MIEGWDDIDVVCEDEMVLDVTIASPRLNPNR